MKLVTNDFRYSEPENATMEAKKAAAKNAILSAINEFGALNTRQIANATQLKRNRVQVLINELFLQKKVLLSASEKTGLGCRLYRISHNAFNELDNINAEIFKAPDDKFRQAVHRSIANNCAIELGKELPILSEHHIHSIHFEKFGKEPDFIGISDSKLVWGEVYSSKPNVRSAARLMHLLQGLFHLYGGKSLVRDESSLKSEFAKYWREQISEAGLTKVIRRENISVELICTSKSILRAVIGIVYTTLKHNSPINHNHDLNIVFKVGELEHRTLHYQETFVIKAADLFHGSYGFLHKDGIILKLPRSLRPRDRKIAQFWRDTTKRMRSTFHKYNKLFNQIPYEGWSVKR